MKKFLTLIAALILTFAFSAVTFAQESPAAPPAPSGTAVEKTKKAPATSKKKKKSTKKKKSAKKKKSTKKKSTKSSKKKSMAAEPAPEKTTP
jgi:hypothetical protein